MSFVVLGGFGSALVKFSYIGMDMVKVEKYLIIPLQPSFVLILK